MDYLSSFNKSEDNPRAGSSLTHVTSRENIKNCHPQLRRIRLDRLQLELLAPTGLDTLDFVNGATPAICDAVLHYFSFCFLLKIRNSIYNSIGINDKIQKRLVWYAQRSIYIQWHHIIF
jgi:hypothetical protein